MAAEHDTDHSPVPPHATVLAGGQNGAESSTSHGGPAGSLDASPGWTAVPTDHQGSAATHDTAGTPASALEVAADPWAAWAGPQLRHAVELAARVRDRGQRIALAPELYRTWFNPVVARPVEPGRSWRPLVGLYRSAHAGSSARILTDGVAMVDRHDVIGRDGWWRTWGDGWRPTHSRQHCVRIVMTPLPDALPEFVSTVTTALIDDPAPWMLACATDVRRLRRSGGAVLHVADPAIVTGALIESLAPTLRATRPPLCLPLAPGLGLAEYPDNGMSFGEHRCHLIALALRTRGARRAPLQAIAEVFASHGIDPRAPHLSPP